MIIKKIFSLIPLLIIGYSTFPQEKERSLLIVDKLETEVIFQLLNKEGNDISDEIKVGKVMETCFPVDMRKLKIRLSDSVEDGEFQIKAGDIELKPDADYSDYDKLEINYSFLFDDGIEAYGSFFLSNNANCTKKSTRKICSEVLRKQFVSDETLSSIKSSPFKKKSFLLEFSETDPKPSLSKINKAGTKQATKLLISGRDMTVVIGNYYPSYDSFDVQYGFYNYHQDDEANFLKAIGLGSDVEAEKKDEEEPAEDEEKKPELTAGSSNTLQILSADLKEYYEAVKTHFPTKTVRERSLEEIKIRIQSCFQGLGSVTQISFMNFMKEFELENKDKKMVIEIGELIKKLNTTTIDRPEAIQIENADEMELTSTFKNTSSSDEKEWKGTYPIIGGLKIDFSSGIVFSGLTDFSYSKINSDSVEVTGTGADADTVATYSNLVRQESGNKTNYAVGVFAHFYPRLSRSFNVSVTLGASVGEDFISQTMVGGSLLVGRKQRFVLSGGFTFGKVDRLRTQYLEDSDKNTPETVFVDNEILGSVSDDQLVNQVRENSWFFSLTWNFGGTRVKVN
ncbi:MAG: hypothetical protein AAF620_08545 [Bacteroidota bacterium]